MKSHFARADLDTNSQWTDLAGELDPTGSSALLASLLRSFKTAGAVHYIEESAYLDRDFSAAYAAFYSTLYQPYLKYCRRLHFFSTKLEDEAAMRNVERRARYVEEQGVDHYLGYIVLRPLPLAPVSSALLSCRHGLEPGAEVSVRSTYKIHLFGAELKVDGAPVTEQDKRTGACAQAAIWSAGRHLHNRHSMPWFSTIDITEAAVKTADSILSRTLPVGSESLTADSMIRALRTMGEHPIVYGPDEDGGWEEPPVRIISRYLDSGIPVIVGFDCAGAAEIGHAVVAVGSVIADHAPARAEGDLDGRTIAERVTHILVNDDHDGIYQRVPVTKPRRPGKNDYKYNLSDADLIVVPLPNKVFIAAEKAETFARNKVREVANGRALHISQKLGEDRARDWAVDPDFYKTPADELVARTYLTYGWKYKHRMLRNTASSVVKQSIGYLQLPRFVWVTEFSLAADVVDLDPCQRQVRAHVVTDATGSSDSIIITQLPGILISRWFDPAHPSDIPKTDFFVMEEDKPFLPKVRGWNDYAQCAVPNAQAANADAQRPRAKAR